MSVLNPMERIRKLSGMPTMKGGYPPKTHRKCSDWASYHDAVDTVTRDLVSQLMQCQAGALEIATKSADHAGKVAQFQEQASDSDRSRAIAAADKVGLEHKHPTDVRDQITEAIEGTTRS